LAIFGGIHGDEPVGLVVLKHLRESLKLNSGTVYLVEGNPRAIEKNVRQTERNLNRCFLDASHLGTTYEEKRAVKLMELLSSCDALLDLHSYTENHGNGTPFAIADSGALEVANELDIEIVVSGTEKIADGGTNDYMSKQGKVGICVELGAKDRPDDFIELGIDTTFRFLQYFGVVKYQNSKLSKVQKKLRVSHAHFRQSKDFSFVEKFKSFDFVAAGKQICIDGGKTISAMEDMHILFPNGGTPIGAECFVTVVDN